MTLDSKNALSSDSPKPLDQGIPLEPTQQEKGSLKTTSHQGISKSKRVSVLKGVSGAAQSVGYLALGVLTAPSAKAHKHFSCKATHASSKVLNAISAFQLGESYIYPLRNVVRSKIFNSTEEKEAAESLLEKCKEGCKEDPRIGVTKIPLKTASTDGVCWGFRLDAANDYLNSPEKTSEERVKFIAEKNRKGVNKETAAYQAVSVVLNIKYNENDWYDAGLFQPILQLESGGEEIKASDLLNSLFLLDGKAQKRFSNLVLNEIQSGKGDRYSKLLMSLEQKNKGSFTTLIQDVISSNPQLLSAEGRINDLGKFQEAVKQAIENRYNDKNISNSESLESLSQQKIKASNSLKWLISSLEVSQGISPPKETKTNEKSDLNEKDKSTNPWNSFTRFARRLFKSSPSPSAKEAHASTVTDLSHRFFFQSQYNLNTRGHINGIIEQTTDIKAVSVDKIMGWPALHKSDEEFFETLHQLPKGFYGIDLKAFDISHAISYIKDEDDPNSGGWILDPNRGIFRCSNEKDTVDVFRKVLSFYPLPEEKNPLALKNVDHQLSILKLEKYSEPQTLKQDTNAVLALCEKKNEGDVNWTMRLAKIYEEKGEMEKAIAWYEKAAEQGNGRAMKALGLIYRYDKGLENHLKAKEWFEKAAALLVKDDSLLLELGVLYALGGFGLDQDGKKAIEFGERVVEKGNPRGFLLLGLIYQEGRGVEKNQAKAIEYFQLGAEKGEKDCKIKLSKLQQNV